MSDLERGDEIWMREALMEARKGLGLTSPNPAVGAVVVRDGVELGRGFHRSCGEGHAEVNALRALSEKGISPEGATIYVTLEPCSTVGKTGACCDRILESGIRRVVVGSLDCNPAHSGRGIELLRDAGLEVSLGVLNGECDWLIRGFSKVQREGLPYVTVKAAVSLDGVMTRPAGEGQWLTGEEARKDVAELRAVVDAVLVGGETLRKDDPRLDVRGLGRSLEEQPRRVVLTRSGDLGGGERFRSAGLEEREVWFRGRSFDLKEEVLPALVKEGMNHVLVEAGGSLLKSFFAAGLVDEVVWYVAPRYCGGGVLAAGGGDSLMRSVELGGVDVKQFGDDVRISGVVV